MKSVNIEIPKGHVIDLEKSSLADGNVVFKKVEDEYPTSWEGLKCVSGYYFDNELNNNTVYYATTESSSNKKIFPTKQDAESSLALSQLLQLRKAYVGDWVADWEGGSYKYIIKRFENRIQKNYFCNTFFELSFPTEKLRDHFLKHHKDLLEVYFKIK
jgi:hypothetical protein